jgi:hypothetical protein
MEAYESSSSMPTAMPSGSDDSLTLRESENGASTGRRSWPIYPASAIYILACVALFVSTFFLYIIEYLHRIMSRCTWYLASLASWLWRIYSRILNDLSPHVEAKVGRDQ